MAGYAQVIPDVKARALSRAFLYAVPDELDQQIGPGSSVQVPFGARTVMGVVIERTGRLPDGLTPEQVKPITKLLDPEPIWGQAMLELAAWLRDFYVTTWQLALQAVIPAPVMNRLRAESTRQRKGRKLKQAAVDGVELGGYAKPELTPVQHEALEGIRAARREHKPVLLFGVTGSGKTEIYLRAVAEVLDEGGQAMVLVPEVALTPQAMERYRGRLGETVAVLHSGLSPVQRRTEWWKLRQGEARVALGTRSAVFAPLTDLSLVIIDEEHEHSYKQSEEPRYHARQVAAFRASRAGASIVLGSATPSLESFYLAERGYYRLIEMPERATGGQLPEVVRVDMRRHGRNKLLSYPLVKAISERLALKQQTVLLLNRRGFSAYLQCYECGHVCQCPDCSISLTFHRSQGRLVCHYCGYQCPPPTVCPTCSGTNFSYQGAGTERLEEELGKSLPGIRIARMDRDTTSRPGAHGQILERFAQGEADVLLGTQMVAKGLDFPGVTLVGVVNADGGLHLPDFRASERTFQLITQVAGRAGRGQWSGEVFVQAMDPDHPCLVAAATHDFRAFYERELTVREHSLYPPFCRLVRVGVSGLDEEATARAAHRLGHELGSKIEQAQLLGPAPCPLQRIRGRYRWHLLLKGSRVQDMARTARNTLDALAHSMSDFRFLVDPDPQSLM